MTPEPKPQGCECLGVAAGLCALESSNLRKGLHAVNKEMVETGSVQVWFMHTW